MMQVLLVLALALASAEPASPSAPPEASRQTTQQKFDDASAAASGGNCVKAVSLFEEIEKQPRFRKGTVVAAAIAVRKGACLVRLSRSGEGEAAIEEGLPILAGAGEKLIGDVVEGQNALGDAAMARWDYAGATRAYLKSLALLTGRSRTGTLIKLAKSTAFDGGPESLAYAQEAIDLATAAGTTNKESLAALHTLHARILLNQGQAKPAFDELKLALNLSGGLTSQTTLGEVSLRGDLAMAAMQLGRKDDARLYLAYTGAGRIAESPFALAVDMEPPVCGKETGLRPEDVAVVEFSMKDDGSVGSAQTVYTRGNAAVASTFAKAVSEWNWRPEDIVKIPRFYRAVTRLELRCSTVMGLSPGVGGAFYDRFANWAKEQLPASLVTSENQHDQAQKLREFAAESARNGNMVGQVAALALLSGSSILSPEKRLAAAEEAVALAGTAQIPAEVRNWITVSHLSARLAKDGRFSNADCRELLAASQSPAIAADPIAANTLRLYAAMPRRTGALAEAPQLLLTVATDQRLAEHHPLRQLAWLTLADQAAKVGDRAKAQDYFSRTGLTSQQCALLGSPPVMRRTRAGSEDYPKAAMMMGFEGWVRLEFDISADGKAVGSRPIVAYPPLIFGEAATAMTKDFQFDLSYRPDSSVACSASQTSIRFSLPKF